MTSKLDQAVDLIKAGNTKTGFEILRTFLAENPDSEKAWWVMSGLVPADRRVHCLEEVLRINPQNEMAREALQRIQASPLKPEVPHPPDRIDTPPPPSLRESPASSQSNAQPSAQEAPVDKQPAPAAPFRTWLYAQRSRIYLTLLGEDVLISAVTSPKQLSQVKDAVLKGSLPDSLVNQKTVIPMSSIISLRQIMSSLRVYYQAGGQERSLRLELEDQAMADRVLDAAAERLGDDFVRSKRPVRRLTSILISVVLTLGAAALTAFFYWGAREVAAGRAASTGSFRTRAIINLLETLGPTGVMIIGGVLILLAVGISSLLLIRPPTVTELARGTEMA